jgi:LIM domain-binding protein 1
MFTYLFQESDNLWWDAFATEFFEDEATLTLTFCLEDGPKRYSKCIIIVIHEELPGLAISSYPLDLLP